MEHRVTVHQVLLDTLDQLDLALDQLLLRDRNFDRFALMLVDNVLELVLHNHALDRKHEIDYDKAYLVRDEPPRHNERAVADALGQEFNAKVALAEKTGFVLPSEAASFRHLHRFRNLAYHQGIREAGIFHALASFYLRLACEMLAKYNSPRMMYASADIIPVRAQKYIGVRVSLGTSLAPLHAAFAKLAAIAREQGEATLIADLTAEMKGVIEETDWDLDFLMKGPNAPPTRDELVVWTQAWSIAFTSEGIAVAAAHGVAETDHFRRVDWFLNAEHWKVLKNGQARIRKDPVRIWQGRLGDLARESDHHVALEKFCSFMAQTQAFREDMDRNAGELDRSIQLEIDIARGK